MVLLCSEYRVSYQKEQAIRVYDSQGVPHLLSSITVLSGVPQGTILGPSLFNFYINDAPNLLSNLLTLYADDSKLVGKAAIPSDLQSIQTDLDILGSWADKWLLSFNAEKCHVIHFGKHNPHQQYHLQGNPLSAVTEERDLGVIVDHRLSFSTHAKSVSSSAFQSLGLIKRTISSRHPKVFMKLYKALVCPHLEIGMSLASPYFKKDREILEKVQRRATKMVDGLKQVPYKERLRHLKLPTLTYQRKRGDMILTHKVISKNTLPGLLAPPERLVTRGHSMKIFKKHSSIRERSHFFSQQITNLWNQLSEDTVSSDLTIAFKQRLDKDWQQQEFLYNWEAAESTTQM